MKKLLLLFAIMLSQFTFANMASPFNWGTIGSNAFSSADIDILREKIFVSIDSGFKTAAYDIEYIIRSDVHGVQIPLMFYAKDLKSNFKVWLDDEEIQLVPIPDNVKTSAPTFSRFSRSFMPSAREGEPETIVISWSEHGGFVCPISDLMYFYANLTEGEHRIHVTYAANVSITEMTEGDEYSFLYSLSPAAHWRSFGSLEITVDATKYEKGALQTNLGNPAAGSIDSVATWHFNKLPADYFSISYFQKLVVPHEPYPSMGSGVDLQSPVMKIIAAGILLVIFCGLLFFIRRGKNKRQG
ncbi:MAG: hypothetical protein JWO09_1423 [Bacteroidetes bacterium]|nr:hypothetical protein [Bacteroidota bacterium]